MKDKRFSVDYNIERIVDNRNGAEFDYLDLEDLLNALSKDIDLLNQERRDLYDDITRLWHERIQLTRELRGAKMDIDVGLRAISECADLAQENKFLRERDDLVSDFLRDHQIMTLEQYCVLERELYRKWQEENYL